MALFATAGATSSGLDCQEVDKVIFQGFLATIEDLLQCSGRCGRSAEAHPGNSSFTMVISLNSLVALMTRIFIIPKYEAAKATKEATTNPTDASTSVSSAPTTNILSMEELAKRQWEKLKEVLYLVCINNGQCIHYQLERLMLHPYVDPVNDMDECCDGACWRCSVAPVSTPLDCPINKDRLKEYLVAIFITAKLPASQLSLHRDCFLNELLNYETPGLKGKPIKNFHKAVFGVKTVQTARPRTKALILKCFAAEILEPEVDGYHLRAKLGYSNNGNPRLNDDSAWVGFLFIEKDKSDDSES